MVKRLTHWLVKFPLLKYRLAKCDVSCNKTETSPNQSSAKRCANINRMSSIVLSQMFRHYSEMTLTAKKTITQLVLNQPLNPPAGDRFEDVKV